MVISSLFILLYCLSLSFQFDFGRSTIASESRDESESENINEESVSKNMIADIPFLHQGKAPYYL